MNLRSFAHGEQLINEAARYCTALLQRNLSKDPFLLALSGGRTAEALFNALTQLNTPAEFSRVHFFWADERCVPPGHEQSNFATAHRCLLAPLRIAADHVHRIPGELNPAIAAKQAEDDLRKLVSSDRVPALDLVLLGMGEDGHVASLFPGQKGPPDRLFYDVVGPKPPPQRVTMSSTLLANSRQTLAIVSGSAKAQALRRSIQPGDTPFGELISSGMPLEVWTDFPL